MSSASRWIRLKSRWKRRNNFIPWRIVKGARATNQEPRFLLNNVPFLSQFPTEIVLLDKIFLYGGHSIFWYLPHSFLLFFSLIFLCDCSFIKKKHNYCLFNSNIFKQIFEKISIYWYSISLSWLIVFSFQWIKNI